MIQLIQHKNRTVFAYEFFADVASAKRTDGMRLRIIVRAWESLSMICFWKQALPSCITAMIIFTPVRNWMV
jgi:hypothetical protein